MASETGKVAIIKPHLDATDAEVDTLIHELEADGYDVTEHENESPFSLGARHFVLREGE